MSVKVTTEPDLRVHVGYAPALPRVVEEAIADGDFPTPGTMEISTGANDDVVWLTFIYNGQLIMISVLRADWLSGAAAVETKFRGGGIA